MADYYQEHLKIRAQAAPWFTGIEFFASARQPMSKTMQVVVGLEIEERDTDDASIQGASFLLGNSEAQVLMDDLWQSGLRPAEGTGSAGALSAVGRHLEDYRKLVERLLPNALGDK